MKALVLALTLVGCGTVNVAPGLTTPSPSPSPSATSPQADASTTSSSSQVAAPAEPKLVEKLVTWGQAVADAPIGYRLATRGEAVEYQSSVTTPSNDAVWTSTENGADEAYFVSMHDGTSESVNIATSLMALYLPVGGAQ